MKLKELQPVLRSQTGQLQWCIVYDWEYNEDVARGSVEYAIEHYGDSEVRRIYSCYEDGQDYIVIEIL